MIDPTDIVAIPELSARLQFGCAAVIAAMAVILWNRPGDVRRHHLWVSALVVFAVGLGAIGLTLGWLWLPTPAPALAAVLSFVYNSCAMLFGLLLVGGSVASRTAWKPDIRFVVAVVAASTLVAVAGPALAPVRVALFGWQNALGALCFSICALLLWTSPDRRGSIGTKLTAAVMLAFAVIWSVNAVAFIHRGQDIIGASDWTLRYLENNSFIDTALELLLGFSMMLLLNEELLQYTVVQQQRERQAVAASEARLTSVIESARDGIVTLDAGLRIVQSNAAAVRMFGSTDAAMRGVHFDDFVASSEEASASGTLSIDDSGHGDRRQFIGRRADGSTFPGEASVAPLDSASGGGWVCVIRDDTASERAAEEQERLRQRLAQAQRLETVGQMVSGVAHELNNPLAAILAFAEELRHASLTSEDADAVEIIAQQAQRCRAIVRDLLRIARQRELDRVPVDVARALDSVMRAQRLAFDEASVVLRLETGAVPSVMGDGPALEQVVANLVSNARYAAPIGSTVLVKAGYAEGRVIVTIEDEGAGLPDDVQSRLFEPFFTTKPEGEGTGLGLAVSRGLVAQLGGTLTLENRAVGGAIATISLPALETGVPTVMRRDVTNTPARLATGGPARHALLIDDEPAVRAAVRRYLQRLGWVVDEVSDGGAALERIIESPDRYDAYVCDIRMPGVSGVELYDRLAVAHPQVLARLIYITGDVASPQVAEFLARTMVTVVEKPFDLAELGETINAVAAAGRSVPMPQTPLQL